MKVIRAEAMGLCFGVRDALAMAEQIERPKDVAVHGELVHNEQVLVQLESRGFQMVREQDRGRLTDAPAVLVTAHGISDKERARLRAASKVLIDTTCPLVRRVHRAAQTLADEGFHVLVIGRHGHVEVQGIVEDLSSYDVLDAPDAVRRYPYEKLGVVCQSTTPPKLAEEIRARVRSLNGQAEIREFDTICQPTRDRQEAVEQLAASVDAVVVVGGRNSNNTRQLLARCRDRGVPAFHIQSADDIQPEWFRRCSTVGLTAGTSTLDATIDDVYQALCSLK